MRGHDKVKNPLRKLAGLLKVALFAVFMTILTGCAAPARFPQFAEQSIAGPGVYKIPQWSWDSHYLAFEDMSRPSLMVYDTGDKTTWSVATDIAIEHFSWGPNNTLTYLKYRFDLSGSPFPIISDMHQVDFNGENDHVIVPTLSGVGMFAWFNDGQRIAILRGEQNNNDTVYITNITAGTTDILLKAQDIGLQYLVMFALSPDEKFILLYGGRQENSQYEVSMVIYSLETNAVLERINPGEIIPSGGVSYPMPGIGDGTNAGWVGGERWFLAVVNTPGGECYNYALFFFDVQNTQNSFCMPTVSGIVGEPTISPDIHKIAYVTVVGVADEYLMLGDVTPDLLSKLGQQ